jgi:hypothetical protein
MLGGFPSEEAILSPGSCQGDKKIQKAVGTSCDSVKKTLFCS